MKIQNRNNYENTQKEGGFAQKIGEILLMVGIPLVRLAIEFVRFLEECNYLVNS